MPDRDLVPPTADRWSPATAAAVGAVLTAVAVVAGGRVGPPGGAHLFTGWAGLLRPVSIEPVADRAPGLLLAAAVLGLAVAWVAVTGAARRGALTAGQLWGVGAAWAAPLVLGPPLLSNDAYSYVAQGALARYGADPTSVPAIYLGPRSVLLHAVDPRWRGTPSPYGPLATAVEKLAAGAGDHRPVLAVLALRAVALVSVVVMTLAAVALRRTLRGADPRATATTVALTLLNPIVLLQVVSAAHLEGLIAALTVVALLVAVRWPGARRPWGWAVGCALAGAVAAVKLPVGLLLLAALLAAALVERGEPRTAVRRVALGTAAAGTTWWALATVTRSGWNVVTVLTTPASGRTLVAPATFTSDLLTPLRWVGLARADDLDLLGRGLWAAAGLVAVGALLASARRRSPVETAGACLLVAAAAAPVLYPWYLVWGVVPLAAVARGRAVDRLVLLSAVGGVVTIQGLTREETIVVTVGVVLAVAARLVWTEPALREAVLHPRAAVTARARRAAAALPSA